MLLASLRFLIGLYILMLLSFQYFVYNFYLFLHIWKDNKIMFYLVSCTLQHLCFRLSLWVLFNYSTGFSCWRNVTSQCKTTEQHSVWHTSDSFPIVRTKDRSSYLSLFKLMSTSYRNGVKAYSMLSGIKSPLLTLADTLITRNCDAMQTQGTWPRLLSSVLWSCQYSELLVIHSLSNIFRRCPAFFYNSKVDFPLWSRLNYIL